MTTMIIWALSIMVTAFVSFVIGMAIGVLATTRDRAEKAPPLAAVVDLPKHAVNDGCP